MRYLMLSLTFLITIFASFASIQGGDHCGVPVYIGAWLDTQETNFLRKQAGADSYFYRTGDSVKKVIAFYQKQPGVTSLGSDESGGMFVKEHKGYTMYIKVQRPWQPTKGGEMEKDTCIVIAKE